MIPGNCNSTVSASHSWGEHVKQELPKNKHQDRNSQILFSNYFTNKVECPFEENGCMFTHSVFPQCIFREFYINSLCQHRHESFHLQLSSWSFIYLLQLSASVFSFQALAFSFGFQLQFSAFSFCIHHSALDICFSFQLWASAFSFRYLLQLSDLSFGCQLSTFFSSSTSADISSICFTSALFNILIILAIKIRFSLNFHVIHDCIKLTWFVVQFDAIYIQSDCTYWASSSCDTVQFIF